MNTYGHENKITGMVIFIVLLLAFSIVNSETKLHERDYQKYFCNLIDGKTEVVLDDRTRVDCVTDTEAIEVDFAKKYFEAIGQSLHYGRKLNKSPAILLIVEKEDDFKYVRSAEDNIEYWKLPINIYLIEKEDMEGD